MNPNRDISSGRKATYYVGLGIAILGFLSFFSVFISFALHFGDSTNFEAQTRSMTLRAAIGMGMMIGGMVLSSIGRGGAAGSGLVLDPQQARSDLEPWSRMAGGVAKDALDEAGISFDKKAENMPFDEQIRRLHKLHQDGIISTAEYEAKKNKILEKS